MNNPDTKIEWVIGDEARPIKCTIFDGLVLVRVDKFLLGTELSKEALLGRIEILDLCIATSPQKNEMENIRDEYLNLLNQKELEDDKTSRC